MTSKADQMRAMREQRYAEQTGTKPPPKSSAPAPKKKTAKKKTKR